MLEIRKPRVKMSSLQFAAFYKDHNPTLGHGQFCPCQDRHGLLCCGLKLVGFVSGVGVGVCVFVRSLSIIKSLSQHAFF
jgi:hypothetical protein